MAKSILQFLIKLQADQGNVLSVARRTSLTPYTTSTTMSSGQLYPNIMAALLARLRPLWTLSPTCAVANSNYRATSGFPG